MEKKEDTIEQVDVEQTIDVQTDDKDVTATADQAVEQSVVTPSEENPRKKSRWLSNIFFIVSIVLSLYLMYSFASSNDLGQEKSFVEVFSNINVTYLVLSVATVISMVLLDSLKYVVIMNATRIKTNFRIALSTSLLGKYYDNITPFSSGGQPMQIYYLHKKGIGGGESSAIICIKFAFNMMMWLTICFCLMLFNRDVLVTHIEDLSQRNLLTVAGWIGFAFNCMLPLLIFSCVVFPKITWAITRWTLNIGYKLRIVKDKEARLERGKNAVNNFVNAFVSMIKRPLHSIVLALLCIAEPFLSMLLPFFVVVAIGGPAVTPSVELMFEIMTLNVYAQMSAMIIPTPGNSGAVESAFMLALTTLSTGALFWTVFSWRFLSYYSYIIVGTCIVVYQLIKNNRRGKALSQ
ncbi:MAG: flippase-like domain-containing protein [Clostridiales bacterium]|nr:flippase-like domain-containing protein [Clostridiales bacterium]